MKDLVAVTGVAVLLAAAPAWTPQPSGTTVRLRGVSAVDARVAWASGQNGTVLRTPDGGAHWEAVGPPGAGDLDLRDVDAVSADVAYALSIGPGAASRIFKTEDAGRHWVTQFVNQEEKAFYNSLAFWDPEHGVATSDSIDGRFVVLLTSDGGHTWSRVASGALPPALPGEGGFAASGTAVTVAGSSHAWIGTGAGPQARVLRTEDGGRTWAVAATPLPSGPSSGIFSVAFRDTRHGILVGGDYKQERAAVDNVAVTNDGGRTWELVKAEGLGGHRSAVAWVDADTVVAVGPSGADLSADGGRHWRPLDGPGLHALSVAPRVKTGWGVGEHGVIARLDAR